ncbi:MAG: glycosyltransferase family 9 protein [Planctomycetota bacterium]|nr:glycosyltransferase family 9 protein [Planctomycetota bacterium]
MTRALASNRRVIVRLPAWLGDCVMVEPVVRALLATHARVTLVGSKRFADLFVTSHARYVALERGGDPRVEDWRGHDVALLLDGSWRGAWAAVRAGIPERIGFASGARSVLLTTALTPALERGANPLGVGRVGSGARRLPRPFGSACVELAALAGLVVIDREPRITVSAEIAAHVADRLSLHGISAANTAVFVHAGARPDSAKGAPIEMLIAIVHALVARGSPPIVLVCAPGEEAHARSVATRCPGVVLLTDPALDIVETIAAHGFARVALVTDGGSRHLATAAHRVPLVVLHGPTDPRHTADHRSSVRIVRVDVECGPCHEELCRLELDEYHQCMRRIDPARVADVAFELMSRAQ